MQERRISIWPASLLVSIALLGACAGSHLEIGMVETNLGGEWRASYTTFTGRKAESIRGEAGQSLTLTYDIKVDKGSLSIQVRSPDDGVLWETKLHADQSDAVTIALEQEGRYSIVIAGENAGGGWRISTDVD